MSFFGLAPWQAALLVAATAAAIVALYWLKPPPLRVVVASNLLWRRVLEERGRRSDLLRWWISLLLALAVGGLIASALGRPELGRQGMRRIAVVIDSSPTMATRSPDGRTRWDHATALARRLLGEGNEGSEFLIVDTSAQVAAPDFEDREAALGKLVGLHVSGARPPAFPRLEVNEAEVYFISDGVMVDPALAPPQAHRVSVYEPAVNVGISTFEIRPVPSHPLDYQAFLEIVNGSADVEEGSLQLSGTMGRSLRRDFVLPAGGSVGMSFDLTSFEGGAVRASVTAAGDSLDADNFAFSYLPAHRPIRAHLVSPGNPFLEAFLRLEPRIELTYSGPEASGELPVADVFVLDRWAPAVPPPRPVLLFHPPPVDWLPAPVGEVLAPEVTEWAQGHPLLQFVSLNDLAITRATRIEPGEADVVASSLEAPLILAAESPVKWIELSFGLGESNLGLQPSFPVFLSNALTWLAGESLALKREVGSVEVPLTGAEIVGLDGETVPSREILGGTVFEAAEPGLFTAVRGTKRLHVAVGLSDADASFVNRSRFGGGDASSLPPELPDEGERGEELWIFLLALAVCLLVVEWWTYHRRLTV